MRSSSSRSRPLPASKRSTFCWPVSITSVTPSTVSDVSATFVARITLRAGDGRERVVLLVRARAGRAAAGRARRRRRPASSACARRISRRAGQEAQDVAAGRGEGTAHRLDERQPGRVRDRDGVRPAGGLDHRAAAEECARPAPRRASPTSRAGAGRRARATPAARGRARGRRAGCARGTRRGRSCGSRRGAGPTAAAPVRTPSVATSRRVRAVKRRSKRTCQPTSSPSVQPCSAAIRRAIERAATRRGCSRNTGPSSSERRRDARRLARAGRGDEDGGPRRGERRAHRADVGVDRAAGLAPGDASPNGTGPRRRRCRRPPHTGAGAPHRGTPRPRGAFTFVDVDSRLSGGVQWPGSCCG